MQPQRDVGVLGGIACGRLEIDLIERDLLGALADDLLVLQRAEAEVERGHGIHVVARRRGVQHVRLEHRVVLDAAQHDAVIQEDVGVVLQMMPNLRRGALEPRFEPREHGVAVQLVGCAGVAVRERNVRGLAGRDGQRDADELGAHVGQARRLGVERDERRGGDALAPALERCHRDDGLVAAGRPGERLRLRALKAPRRRSGGGHRCVAIAHAAQQPRELQPLEQGAEARRVLRPKCQLLGLERQLDIAADRRELLR